MRPNHTLRLSLSLPVAILACCAFAASACSDAAGGVSSVPDLGIDLVADTGMADTGLPDTGMVDMGMDMTGSGLPCGANQDCPAGEVCTFVIDAGMVSLVCMPPIGSGGPGAACMADADCESGLCLDGQCAAPCGADEQCPTNFMCEDRPVGDETIGICIPGAQPCASNAACMDGNVCVADRSGTMLDLLCGPSVGVGAVGDVCGVDGDCASNLCLTFDGASVCSDPCESNSDCGGTLQCAANDIPLGGGGTASATVCQPLPPTACISDATCASPERCVASKSPTEVSFSCGAPNANGRESGEICGGDADCAQNLCHNGQCAGPCASEGDCPTDYGCSLESIDLGGAIPGSANVCTPPTACLDDDTCLLSEVCYIRKNQTDISLLCNDPNLFGADIGEVCTADGDCASNLCLTTRFRDVCTAACDDNNDCIAGYECTTQPITANDGTSTEDIGVCTPLAPSACDSNADCASGVCAIVSNVAGTALESVCIPNAGGSNPGVLCTDNSDCANDLCLNGFCSAPCDTTTDCGFGQICTSSSVSKDMLMGTFDVCLTPPDVVCDSSADCSATSRVCGELEANLGINEIEGHCTFPNNGGSSLGETCAAPGDCFHNICQGVSSECTVHCAGDTDCASGQICSSFRFTINGVTDDVPLCIYGCVDDNSCDIAGSTTGTVCSVTQNFVDNTIDQICQNPSGAGDIGAPCTDANGNQDGGMCVRGICLRTTINTSCNSDTDCSAPYSCLGGECAVDECTAICNDAGDCGTSSFPGNALTLCSSSVTIPPPLGGTPVNISTCARN